MVITSPDEQAAATLRAVARFNAAFDLHDADAVMAAMTDDCVFENTGPAPDGDRYEGASAVRAFWERFFRSNPQARFTTEEQFAAGDRCVVRWRYDWEADPAPDVSSSEARVHHVRGVDVYRVRDGRVAEKLAYVKG